MLIEGPRDASHLIPLLTHPKTRMPVAIYTTYVSDSGATRAISTLMAGRPTARHAAYYPLCDYSPELAAIRAAAEPGITARFIDLTFPEMVDRGPTAAAAQRAISLFEERHLFHSDLLREACRRTGVRDPDDLWDQLYELDRRAQGHRGVLPGRAGLSAPWPAAITRPRCSRKTDARHAKAPWPPPWPRNRKPAAWWWSPAAFTRLPCRQLRLPGPTR